MATANQKITLSVSRDIPFNKLELSQANVRRTKAGISIEELAGDIAHRGLLMSLNVRPVLDDDGKPTGSFKVPAGGRRYRALELLIRQKKLAKTAPVPCIVSEAETSEEEDSLAENAHREQLHPLDQFRAFQTLREQGLDEEAIAARFFVTAATVRQRLRLASVSSKLLDLYADDEIRLEQIMAFSITDDHERQEAVWETVSHSHVKEPYYIKRLLTETAVRADDRRARYVGGDAYEAAGGVILRDLFQQDGGGWFQDPALLERLVVEKMQADAETFREEGWKWVDVALDFPYGHRSGLRRIYGEPVEMTAEEFASHDTLKAEYDTLDGEYAAATEYDEEVENKLDQLGGQLDALNDRPEIYDADEVRRAGVFVSLDANGTLRIDRGFVKPEDEAQTASDAAGHGEESTINGVNGTYAGDANDSATAPSFDGDNGDDDIIRPLPDRLVLDLTAQRTLALRNALAGDPTMAFIAVLHALVLQTFYRFGSETCLEISLKSAIFPQAQGLGDTVWAKEIDERQQNWGRDLPQESEDLWTFLIELDGVSRHALFAHCAALSVNAVVEPWNRRPRALAHADQLGQSIGFDIVNAGWVPTVENYFGRVTKAHILEAVREAKGEQSAQLIDHLKKTDMAREAARLLEGSNWVPEPLRMPDDGQLLDGNRHASGEVGGGQAPEPAETVELPAFLAEGDGNDTIGSSDDEEDPSHLDAAE